VDPTVIGAIFTGLAGVLVAWTQMRAQRSGTSGAELREGRRERRRLEGQMLAIRRWAIKVEELLRENGVTPPRRPAQFDLDWGREDDDEEPKSPVRLVRR
jgi:hypothetical protein